MGNFRKFWKKWSAGFLRCARVQKSRIPRRRTDRRNKFAFRGWAQFVSDLLNDANDAKSKCPVSFGVLEKALLDNPNVAGVLENIRQMAELNRNANAWDRVRHQHMLLVCLPFLNHSILVCSLRYIYSTCQILPLNLTLCTLRSWACLFYPFPQSTQYIRWDNPPLSQRYTYLRVS